MYKLTYGKFSKKKKSSYKWAAAVNSTQYYSMMNRYQVTQQWKRLIRTFYLLKYPVSHTKSCQHNCLKESIESFAYVEGGSARSEQIKITLCFIEQAKIN